MAMRRKMADIKDLYHETVTLAGKSGRKAAAELRDDAAAIKTWAKRGGDPNQKLKDALAPTGPTGGMKYVGGVYRPTAGPGGPVLKTPRKPLADD